MIGRTKTSCTAPQNAGFIFKKLSLIFPQINRENMRYFLAVMLFAVSTAALSQPTNIYYPHVSIPGNYYDDYFKGFEPKVLADDLAGLLCCATGKKYTTAPSSGQQHGIFLVIDTTLQDERNETGHLEISGKRITITGKNAAGISYAIYSWLHELGFRFYLPGATWMHIPKISGHFSPMEKTYTPYFKLRMFNASGGSFSVSGLDDEGTIKNEWNTWYRRNRMGSDFLRIDGHKGELFNIVHRKDIENDPAILAPVDGKRKYDVTGKLDPTYSKGVNMYTKWLLQEYKNQLASIPEFLPAKKYQSADMGDGLNYCHTAECEEKFESVSDQAFFIANEAARKVRKEFPYGGISTLAYTERADTPSFRIEPNVHVMVTATAFQHISIPTELMERWAKKHNNISQYDFLNIGVWTYDHPFFNLNQYHSYLQWLRSLSIEGMCFETSLSSMASGMQQYLLLQYLAEPYDDIQPEFEKWCDQLFGKAAAPVKQLFERWYFSDTHIKTGLDKPSFYPDELAEFIHLVRTAENSQGLSAIEKERISILKAYTVYLCGFYELYNKGGGKDITVMSDLKAKALLEYTWGLYSKNIFHNTQLNDLLKKTTSNPEAWNFRKGAIIKKIRPLTDKEVEKNFSLYENRYNTLYSPPLKFGREEMEYLTLHSADSIHIQTIDERSFRSFIYPIKIYAPKAGRIKIKYATGYGNTNKKSDQVVSIMALELNGAKLLNKETIHEESAGGEIVFDLALPGEYTLQFAQFNSTPVSWVIYPEGNLLYVEKKSVIHHGLQLVAGKESGYDNFQLAVWNNKGAFSFQPKFSNQKNTVTFFTGEGKPLKIEADQGSKNYRLTPPETAFPFSFYRNEVFRWPAVVQHLPPYFFFLKQPGKK